MPSLCREVGSAVSPNHGAILPTNLLARHILPEELAEPLRLSEQQRPSVRYEPPQPRITAYDAAPPRYRDLPHDVSRAIARKWYLGRVLDAHGQRNEELLRRTHLLSPHEWQEADWPHEPGFTPARTTLRDTDARFRAAVPHVATLAGATHRLPERSHNQRWCDAHDPPVRAAAAAVHAPAASAFDAAVAAYTAGPAAHNLPALPGLVRAFAPDGRKLLQQRLRAELRYRWPRSRRYRGSRCCARRRRPSSSTSRAARTRGRSRRPPFAQDYAFSLHGAARASWWRRSRHGAFG